MGGSSTKKFKKEVNTWIDEQENFQDTFKLKWPVYEFSDEHLDGSTGTKWYDEVAQKHSAVYQHLRSLKGLIGNSLEPLEMCKTDLKNIDKILKPLNLEDTSYAGGGKKGKVMKSDDIMRHIMNRETRLNGDRLPEKTALTGNENGETFPKQEKKPSKIALAIMEKFVKEEIGDASYQHYRGWEYIERKAFKKELENKLTETMKDLKSAVHKNLATMTDIQKIHIKYKENLEKLGDIKPITFKAPGCRRRLAAMPPSHEPLAPDAGYLPSSGPSAVSVGLVATAGLCAAFVLKRFYNRFTAKARRDSFGFLPDAERTSLDNAERMV